MPVFLLALYAKSARSDLTAEQKKAAGALTEAVRIQYGR